MSRFLQDKETSDESFRQEIDFEDAIRVPDGGSTCEIYRTRWQRREVFVKRLKEEFRTNPLYLDALDKEYEIGVSLKHPSLPDYREFHRDYIVMDYIDGVTLAEMIKSNDPWLTKEKNIVRLFRELIGVVDYIHRHNVTHCDIKPDNIMITNNNRNVVLIDLDKCFTDSLNDTSGDPSKYGLSEKDAGRISIDFHGIGRVGEKLKEGVPDFRFRRYKEFIKECYSPEVDSDKLLSILDYKPVNHFRKYNLLITFAPFVVALIFGTVLYLTENKKETVNPDSNTTEIATGAGVTSSTQKEETVDKKETAVTPVPKSQEEIQSEAQEMAAVLDKRIQPYFDELKAGLDSLELLSQNPDITKAEMLEQIRKHSAKEDEYIQEAFAILNETYSGLDERETWRVMAHSKAYTGYKRRADPLLSKLSQQI